MKKLRALALNGAVPARLAFAAIWFSLFAYAGRPLLVAAHVQGIAPAVAWILLFGLSLVPLMPFFVQRGEDLRKRSLANWIGYATMGVFAMLLVVVAASDLLRLFYAAAQSLIAMPALPLMSPRALSAGAIATAAALSLVGLVQARCPRLKQVSIPIDDLPEDLDGYRIVQWSDVHVGPTIQRRFVQSLVDRTNALEPDAIAITGDLVDGFLHDLRDQVQPLADLCARDGVFYVTGNHEYYWRAGEWLPELQRLGLHFLKNSHEIVLRGDSKLVFAGVTDPAGRYTHTQDVPAALDDAPAEAVKILLSHRPQTARAASELGAHLQLSGHTHGGQFFPFNLVIRWFQPIVAGLHRVGMTWLYVSRGTGYWGPPSRLGVHGEITVLELRRS